MAQRCTWRFRLKKKFVSEIVFNEPLDEALFSVDLPAGYMDLGTAMKRSLQKWQSRMKEPSKMMNTVEFTQIETMKTRDGHQAPELTKHITILDGHLKREEVSIQAGGDAEALPAGIEPHVSIQDSKQNKTIFLLPEKKAFIDPTNTAFIPDYVQWIKSLEKPGGAPGKVNVFAAINYPDEKSTRLPLKMIDGGLVFGKRVEEKIQRGQYTDTHEWKMWLDPFSSHIVQGEVKLTSTDSAIPDVEYVLRDFSEGKQVDRSLFSTDPPQGYSDAAKKK